MKRHPFTVVLCVGSFILLAGLSSTSHTASDQSTVRQRYGALPLGFEPNVGQTDAAVKFVSRAGGYALFLTGDAAVLSLNNHPGSAGRREVDARPAVPSRSDAQARQATAVRMTLVDANRDAEVIGLEPLAGRANYFIGNDPKRWHTNVPTYGKVKYRDVYPGVDLLYYGNQHQLEYDFVVEPGADPKRIVLGLTSQDGKAGAPHIDAAGSLIFRAGDDEIRLERPIIYQIARASSADRELVEGRFVLLPAGRVGFEVGEYDKARPLVIDPVLKYSTLYGGSEYDAIAAVRVLGSTGEAYVTGITDSFADFPTNESLSPHNGSTAGFSNEDAFVAKINADGTGYVWSTYLGGTAQDDGHGIAVDGSGNVYVTGGTNSTDFPVKNAYQDSYPDSGVAEAVFVTKIRGDGGSILYSTYLLGYNNNEGHAIAVDDEGNAFVTGYAEGPANGDGAFPQKNGFVSDRCSAYGVQIGDDVDNQMGGFIARINTTTSGDDSLIYSSVFCGVRSTEGTGIATDGTVHSTGYAYLTGETDWPDFPIKNGFQTSCNGCSLQSFDHEKAFVMKVDTNRSGSDSIVYSTFLGGSGEDRGYGIAADGNGKAYVIGATGSSDFPVTAGAAQTAFNGGFDAFVAKIDPSQSGGASLVWSTFLGGSGYDFGTGIALGFGAASGERDIYVTGVTSSPDLPTRNAPQPKFAGGVYTSSGELPSDAFVARLKPDGSKLLYSTYLGGSGNEQTHVDLFWFSGPSIAVDFSNNVYVGGATDSSDFPLGTAGVNAYLTTLRGYADGFLTKLSLNPDFSLGVISPMSMDVSGSDSKTLTISSLDSFNSAITLSTASAPTGFTTAFSPNPVTPPADDSTTASVTVTAGPGVAAGSYTWNVVGTSGALAHSTPLSVTVNATPAAVTTVINLTTALGCIDNSGVSQSLIAKLTAAQNLIKAGQIQAAINTLTALLQELQAQAGKHIATTCTDSNGQTFDPVAVLTADVQALLASLSANVKPAVIFGSVLNSSGAGVSGATINLLSGSKTVVGTATTDSVGFYYFAATGGLTVGTRYSVSATLPKGYKSSTPSAQSVLWSAGLANVGNLVLN